MCNQVFTQKDPGAIQYFPYMYQHLKCRLHMALVTVKAAVLRGIIFF